MLNAEECRGKAKDALAFAETSRDPQLKRYWEDMARRWTALAVSAELEDRLQRELLDRHFD